MQPQRWTARESERWGPSSSRGLTGAGRFEVAPGVLDRLVSEGLDQLGAVQHAQPLLRAEPVLHVPVLQDLAERAPAAVFADDIRGHTLLHARTGKEKGKRRAQQAGESLHQAIERVVHGVDDAGAAETVVIWIERKQGAIWAVGRAVNPENRASDEPRRDDYVFEGYELDDALDAANGALEDDLTVSESDGSPENLKPFTRGELLKPLERWFFGRR